jgi:predicted nucleic acid-binding protein
LPKTSLISLPKYEYEKIIKIKNKFDLDFDDSYQYSICRYYTLKLVTMDQDFMRVKDPEIEFL